MKKIYRLGIDIGGTFTDFTLYDELNKKIKIEKTLTNSVAPEKGVFDGIEKLSVNTPNLYENLTEIIHATTLITNVILERKGDKIAFLTTAGFKDILEMRREVRYDIYDMFIKFPQPLVSRELRFGIEERVLSSGIVLKPLDKSEIEKVAINLKKNGIKALAVGYLHSYKNNIHEIETRKIIKQILPNLPVSLSHEVVAEAKEYERFSTTTIDAYVKSIAEKYLDKLITGLQEKGFNKKLYVMLSNGGTSTVETAKKVPIQMVESGPAAGVEAACFFSKLLNRKNLLSFDMGGTTAKLCIIENGTASKAKNFEVDRMHRFKSGSGIPVTIPVYDLLEIGAGGGSIAKLNDLNLFQVGPESSGSNPGPVCYGNGGDKPTVTDADLILGYLNPDYFLGGEIKLDVSSAEKEIKKTFSKKTNLSSINAAAGIHEIVNENMASAARVYIGEKGKSSSNLSLIAFGGAGPVHAIGLAEKLGITEIIIPPLCGVMSSVGLLTAPVAFEKSKVIRELIRELDYSKLENDFNNLENEAIKYLDNTTNYKINRSLEVRYLGQDFPLEISVKKNNFHNKVIMNIEARFIKKYNNTYGKVDDDNLIELASIKVRVSQKKIKLKLSPTPKKSTAKQKLKREVFDFQKNKKILVNVFDRSKLGQEFKQKGPLIIEEKESTTVVKLGYSVKVDASGCLIINKKNKN